jgi:hypothetical protein
VQSLSGMKVEAVHLLLARGEPPPLRRSRRRTGMVPLQV